jgi:hypothetical protein
MRFTPGEICHGTLRYGRFWGLDSSTSCRVRFDNCDGSFDEEVVVPASPEAVSLLRSAPLRASVCVHYWDGNPVGVELLDRTS